MYKIKTFDMDNFDLYIEEQFEIGSASYDKWPMGGQTRPDKLKQTYSSDDFTPETRFYAFSDDEMIGFLTSSFKEKKDGKNFYFFEFPYVKNGYDDAEEQLIEHAIQALDDHGADVLVARAGEYWGKSKFYAEKYEFSKTKDIARRAELVVENVDEYNLGDPSVPIDFDFDNHLDQVVKLYANQFSASEEQIKKQLKRWENFNEGDKTKNPWGQELTLLGSFVIMENDQVLARSVGFNVSAFGEDTLNIVQMVIKDGHENVRGDFLAKFVEKAKEYNKNKVIIHTGLWGLSPSDKAFAEYNIEFEPKLAFYEKSL